MIIIIPSYNFYRLELLKNEIALLINKINKENDKKIYEIQLSSNENLFIQMKLYTKFIDEINIIYDNKNINIISNNYFLILFI